MERRFKTEALELDWKRKKAGITQKVLWGHLNGVFILRTVNTKIMCQVFKHSKVKHTEAKMLMN